MRATRQLIGLALALGLAVPPATGGDLKDLYFGEALYHAYQGQYFDALQRLDTELAQYHVLDEPKLDTLHYHINDAEFSMRREPVYAECDDGAAISTWQDGHQFKSEWFASN